MVHNNKMEWSIAEQLVQFDKETVEPNKPLVVWSQGLLQLTPVGIYGSGSLQPLDSNFSFENSNVWMLANSANRMNPNEWNPRDFCSCICGALFIRGESICKECWGPILYAVDDSYIENAEITAFLDPRLRFTQSTNTINAALAPAPHGAVANAATMGELKDDWPRAVYSWLMRLGAGSDQKRKMRKILASQQIDTDLMPFAYWKKMLLHQVEWKKNIYDPNNQKIYGVTERCGPWQLGYHKEVSAYPPDGHVRPCQWNVPIASRI